MDYSDLVQSIVEELLSEALYGNETDDDRGSDRRRDLAGIIRTSRNEPTIPEGERAHISQVSGRRLRFHSLDTPANWLKKAESDISDREDHFRWTTSRENADAEESGGYNDGYANINDDADIVHLVKARDYAEKKSKRVG